MKSLRAISSIMSVDDASPVRDADVWARSTAPQSDYTGREIGIGLVVFLLGLLVSVGVPLALA